MKASIVKRLSLIALAAVFLFALAACGESNNSSSGSSSQPASASAESASGSDAVSGKKVIRIGYQKGNTLNILKVRGQSGRAAQGAGHRRRMERLPERRSGA